MEFVGETLSDLIGECATIAYGLKRSAQEGELQEAKELQEPKTQGMENKHNVRGVRANQCSRIVRSRVPGVRVKGFKMLPFIIIPGRKGKKGEKVVVLGVGQQWTHPDPPITIISDSDSESDTDRGRQTVKNWKKEVVDGGISLFVSDPEDECGLEHNMPTITERNPGHMLDQKSIQGGGRSDISYGQDQAGQSTTTHSEVDRDASLTDQIESKFKFAEEEMTSTCQQKQKIVFSRPNTASSEDSEKPDEVTPQNTTEPTAKVLSGTRDERKKCFQAKGIQPRAYGSTVVIMYASDSEDEPVRGKRCRLNTAKDSESNGKTPPSKNKHHTNTFEPGDHTEADSDDELDSSGSDSGRWDCKFHTGETGEVDLSSLDPKTRMYTLRKMFHECRKSFSAEENNRGRLARKEGEGARGRSDMKAYTYIENKVMTRKGCNSILGEVPGIEVGDYFFYRVELLLVGLHRPIQGGIDFIGTTGTKAKFLDPNGKPLSVAVSVVCCRGRGYENRYEGETLIYTGQGSNNADQPMIRGNLALKNSCDLGLSVRVVRGVEVAKGKPLNPFNFEGCPGVCSPSGFLYVYDGLYKVEKYYQEMGLRGFNLWRFKLVREPHQKNIPDSLKILV